VVSKAVELSCNVSGRYLEAGMGVLVFVSNGDNASPSGGGFF
jgi:hypothetical protein